MEDVGRHVIARAVSSVHHDLEPTQGQVGAEAVLAKLDIAATRVFQAPGAAEIGGVDPGRRLVQRLLDSQLPGIGQLFALLGEELDAVVR